MMTITIFNQITAIFLLLTLISCTTGSIPVKSNGGDNLQQAYQLMSENKSLEAQKLIGDILAMAEQSGDGLMVAKTYAVYGDLYKLGKTQGSLILPDFKKAALSYQQAAKNYHVAGYFITESMLLWTSGVMHSNAGDKDLACDDFADALQAFRLDSIDKNNIKSAEVLPERVKTEQKRVGCI